LNPLPVPPRKERAAIEFPEATWTSFDRYARYGAIVRTARANLAPGRRTALDVGDNSGWLLAFDAELVPISVDVAVNHEALDGTIALIGDGARLPIRDHAVDVALSSDALEHVPPAHRDRFVRELARVSDVVVLAAPFDTPGVAGAEEFVRRYVDAVTGDPQDQLDEHADHGLPSLPDTLDSLRGAGFEVAATGNGNLQDWLLGMMLKHQLTASPMLDQLNVGIDVLYNSVLATRNDVGPFYRHVVVGCRGRTPVLAEPAGPESAAIGTDAVQLALVGASLDLALRHTVWQGTQALHTQQQEIAEHLMARFSGVEAVLARLDAATNEAAAMLQTIYSQLQSVNGLLRHPVRTVGRKVRGDRGEP
jgi:SAM-dependent methyltransferase